MLLKNLRVCFVICIYGVWISISFCSFRPLRGIVKSTEKRRFVDCIFRFFVHIKLFSIGNILWVCNLLYSLVSWSSSVKNGFFITRIYFSLFRWSFYLLSVSFHIFSMFIFTSWILFIPLVVLLKSI